jgi:trehalose 6-phosphate phosphatase
MNETQKNISPRRYSRSLPSPARLDRRRTALLLDVDGTLLDIATTPDGVVVPTSLRDSLAKLLASFGGAVALVSGRTLDMLDRLFSPLRLPVIAGHGAAMRLSPDGPVVKHHPANLSDALRARLHALSNIDSRLLIEDKLHSVAIHYRLALHQEDFLKQEIAAILTRTSAEEAEILPGKAVIEIKPRAFNKGTAVRELMSHPPFSGRVPLFIGDDTTDEAVFAVLPDLAGLGFSVGKNMAGAQGVVPSPDAVRAWLAQLATHAGRTR